MVWWFGLVDAMVGRNEKERRKNEKEKVKRSDPAFEKKHFHFSEVEELIVILSSSSWSVPELLWLWKRIISLPISSSIRVISPAEVSICG